METKTAGDKPVGPQQPTSTRKGPRGGWVVGGVAVIVAAIVFAGGVLAVNQLSAPPREGEFGRFEQRPQFQIEPAKGLPATTPNLQGVVTGRQDKTLSVSQRNGFGPGERGNENTPTLEVVVTGDTTIYHDTTQRNFNGQPPTGPVQQQVEPGSLDEVNTNSRVTVWGDQSGNQLTAKVLVYTDPLAFRPQS